MVEGCMHACVNNAFFCQSWKSGKLCSTRAFTIYINIRNSRCFPLTQPFIKVYFISLKCLNFKLSVHDQIILLVKAIFSKTFYLLAFKKLHLSVYVSVHMHKCVQKPEETCNSSNTTGLVTKSHHQGWVEVPSPTERSNETECLFIQSH